MTTLMVGYDLRKPGRDYSGLIGYLKSLGTWWHHLDSTWLVRTNMSVSQLRDGILTHVDSNDEVLVLDPHTANWASYGLNTEATNWLKQHL